MLGQMLLSIVGRLLGDGARFAIEQKFSVPVRFGVEPGAFKKEEYNYQGQRVYLAKIRVIQKSDYGVRLLSAGDRSGDGLVFFGYTSKLYDAPVIGFYTIPDLNKAHEGSISFEDVEADRGSFILYFSTTPRRSVPRSVAYIHLRYVMLNETQSVKQCLLKIPLADND